MNKIIKINVKKEKKRTLSILSKKAEQIRKLKIGGRWKYSSGGKPDAFLRRVAMANGSIRVVAALRYDNSIIYHASVGDIMESGAHLERTLSRAMKRYAKWADGAIEKINANLFAISTARARSKEIEATYRKVRL